VSDPNSSPNIAGATVTISGNYSSGIDTLGFTPGFTLPSGINQTLTGNVLTLTGNASPSVYQSILRAVTFFNGSTNPATLLRTVTFPVNDGAAINSVGTASRPVSVTQITRAPTIAPIANLTQVLESSGVQTVNLTGLGGGGGQVQNLTITAASDTPTLIPN